MMFDVLNIIFHLKCKNTRSFIEAVYLQLLQTSFLWNSIWLGSLGAMKFHEITAKN